MSDAMTCDRAERAPLRRPRRHARRACSPPSSRSHLAGCAECRELREALADVTVLLRAPARGAGGRPGRAGARVSWAAAARPRCARSARARGPSAAATWAGWLTEVPFAVQAVAAGLALVLTAGLVMAAGSGPGAPARPRVAQRVSDAAVYVLERKDRLVEDFRLLRVVVGTAFEGRVDRVNDRVEDYRRLLERRQKDEPAPRKRRCRAAHEVPKTSEPASRASRRPV